MLEVQRTSKLGAVPAHPRSPARMSHAACRKSINFTNRHARASCSTDGYTPLSISCCSLLSSCDGISQACTVPLPLSPRLHPHAQALRPPTQLPCSKQPAHFAVLRSTHRRTSIHLHATHARTHTTHASRLRSYSPAAQPSLSCEAPTLSCEAPTHTTAGGPHAPTRAGVRHRDSCHRPGLAKPRPLLPHPQPQPHPQQGPAARHVPGQRGA